MFENNKYTSRNVRYLSIKCYLLGLTNQTHM